MIFTAKLQSMASSEILSIIPQDVLARIKSENPHPLFQAYVVGHEGEIDGTLVGIGKRVLNFFSSAINKIWKKLQYGTKFFHGHNVDSSHEGRRSIGEVVGKAIRTIKSKTNAIAIAYIYPEYQDIPLNVASIEADVRINPDSNVHDIDVGEITGIALGNSEFDKPAFKEATLLSAIQAMVSKEEITEHPKWELAYKRIGQVKLVKEA